MIQQILNGCLFMIYLVIAVCAGMVAWWFLRKYKE